MKYIFGGKQMKKGFTIVELLAVIVVLGVILTIAIPVVTNSIESSKKGAFKINAEGVISAIETKRMKTKTFNPTVITNVNVLKQSLNISSDNYSAVEVTVLSNNTINIKLVGAGEWDGLYACGTSNQLTVTTDIGSCNPVTITGDTSGPLITFGTNGNTNYLKTNQTIVTVVDNYVVDASSLKYQWTTSNVAPAANTFTTSFSNGAKISTPAGVTGNYYLWAIAKDGSGNQTITGSNVFNLDNTPPVLAVTGTNPVSIVQYGNRYSPYISGSSYVDPGATATDNIDGNITSNISVTNNVSLNTAGTYTITYNVSDALGNSSTASRTVSIVSPNDSSGASTPVVSGGMIPVYYDSGADTWRKADPQNMAGATAWYNYNARMWANMVTVTAGTRAAYLNAALGSAINMNDILTFFVWVPRYKYLLSPGSGPRSFNIVFESPTTAKSYGDAVYSYLTHPAFTFGSTELAGIWVDKFDPSFAGAPVGPTSAAQGDSIYNQYIDKPNVYIWCNATLVTGFTVSRNLQASGNAYGFSTTGIDTHAMKNTEWGAVAYLSHSGYGINTEIWVNPNQNYITGCGGTSSTAVATTDCYSYNTSYGVNTSASGTVYGIYDIAGGIWTVTMGNYQRVASGFSSAWLNDPNNYKYYDYYGGGTSIKGDAVNADGTSGWYSDRAAYIDTTYPYFYRGGAWYRPNFPLEPGAFAYNEATGVAESNGLNWRVVIAPGV